MKIIYVASTCSREKFSQYVESKGSRVSQQAQKYNLLLAEGLTACGADVHVLSTRPINRILSKKLWFKREKESCNGVNFLYLPFLNHSLTRKLFLFCGTFFRLLFSRKKRKETIVICDALNIAATAGALFACKLRGYRTVGIVTDVPGHLSYSSYVSFNQKLNLFLMQKFKSYLLLTAPMSDIVNPKGRPYIVLEGHADTAMKAVPNTLNGKSEKHICLYAGSLMRIYGIENLVNGFIAANIPNAELHVYGDGNFAEELKQLALRHETVKYMGVAPNAEIVEAELRATLLVNPRPTHEEYTKYSFPSKNMEYMASGTAVLTTRLPGMPKDHEPYVFFIEDETAEGIKAALEKIFALPEEELHAFGLRAKEFILKEKNNKAQAAKVLTFVEEAFGIK